MPNARSVFETLARQCRDRAGRAGQTSIRRAFSEEEADWLALARDDHARRIDGFRATWPAASSSRLESPGLRRAGRSAAF